MSLMPLHPAGMKTRGILKKLRRTVHIRGNMVSDILNYLLIILGIIILYEIIRGLVVAKIREKLYRSVT